MAYGMQFVREAFQVHDIPPRRGRKPPPAPRFRWLVFVPAEGRPDVRTAFSPVPANTASEARGVVKRLLGLERLPVGTKCRKEAP